MAHKKLICLLAGCLSFSATAETLSYSGRLVNADGSPVAGPVTLFFELAYTNSTSSIKCDDTVSGVSLTNGVFHVSLDFDCSVRSGKTFEEVLYEIPSGDSLAIRVTNGSKVYSFQSIHSVPSAKFAHNLSKLNANNNEVLTWTGSKWEPKPIVGATGGTVTDISAGSGLSGGTITNSGTISIDTAGVTNTHLANGILRAKLASGTPNYVIMNDGSGALTEVAQLPLSSGGTGSNTAAGARTNLGLGSSATANIGVGAGTVLSGDVPNCLPSQKLHMNLGPMNWSCEDAVENGSIVDADVASGAAIAQSKIANLTTDLANKQNAIPVGTSDQYFRGDHSLQPLDAAVRGTTLTGLDTTAGTVTSSDSLLTAIGKLVGNVANFLLKSGGTMTGAINMGNNKITNLGTPTATTDAATKSYVDGKWVTSGSNIYSGVSGNVGIGNTSPSYKLSVAGTIESSSGGFRFPDGTTQTTAAVGAFVVIDMNGWASAPPATPNTVSTVHSYGAYGNAALKSAISGSVTFTPPASGQYLIEVDVTITATGAGNVQLGFGPAGGFLGHMAPTVNVASGSVTRYKSVLGIAGGNAAVSFMTGPNHTNGNISINNAGGTIKFYRLE
ncbi:autotransporter outer membrane beta-barrel domain-containing protein [Peredibacter starrii]|uniref:C1q domain-containing protein n=1 Tax=Peredibacter starrii TaxID=28202 RepID=A0AAX4HKK3_9BACT|nr:hypothetical protein [Peredibacter starrii]WPU63777.1 hypothetical protein SOO65_13870 [Peredibacter starrii]